MNQHMHMETNSIPQLFVTELYTYLLHNEPCKIRKNKTKLNKLILVDSLTKLKQA